jgi:hypothetical protein
MNQRTDAQCMHRWRNTIDPGILSGHWKKDEDTLLRLALESYKPTQWILIQRHIPGRTDVKCRERFVNVIKPDLKKVRISLSAVCCLLSAVCCLLSAVTPQ